MCRESYREFFFETLVDNCASRSYLEVGSCFGIRKKFSKNRIDPVMLTFIATTKNAKRIRTVDSSDNRRKSAKNTRAKNSPD